MLLIVPRHSVKDEEERVERMKTSSPNAATSSRALNTRDTDAHRGPGSVILIHRNVHREVAVYPLPVHRYPPTHPPHADLFDEAIYTRAECSAW